MESSCFFLHNKLNITVGAESSLPTSNTEETHPGYISSSQLPRGVKPSIPEQAYREAS